MFRLVDRPDPCSIREEQMPNIPPTPIERIKRSIASLRELIDLARHGLHHNPEMDQPALGAFLNHVSACKSGLKELEARLTALESTAREGKAAALT